MRHDSHFPHGSSAASSLSVHNNECANSMANRRLPTPGGPTNKYVLASRPDAKIRRNWSTTSSCPRMPCHMRNQEPVINQSELIIAEKPSVAKPKPPFVFFSACESRLY